MPPEEVDFDKVSYHYEEAVDEGLKLALGGEPSDYYLQVKARETADHCRRRGLDPAKLSALDVGCGTGRMVQLLSPQFAKVQGVEPSAGMLDRALKLGLPEGTFRRGSGESLPFEAGAFDVVFSACIFHHSPRERHAAMLREMARVLKPGGLLFTFEHNPFNPMTRWVVSRCPVDVGVTLHSARELQVSYAEAGLKDVETRYIIFFPKALSRLRSLEPALHLLPAGAQYYLCGRT